MKQKVTIIIPYYNSEKTLDRCLNSVLNQTHKNLEIILINDGSKDKSYSMVEAYKKNDSRIISLTQINKGVSSARNRGLKIATGDYIQFVDSDDDIEPDMIEKMLKRSIETEADIVVCNYTHPILRNYFGNSIIEITNLSDVLKYYQSTFAGVVPWNKLYKKEVIKVQYDEDIHFTEDDLFHISNLFNAKRIAGLDEVLYHYYVAPNDTPAEELSCIIKIALAPKFWETKKTYWYMRMALKDKTIEALKTFIKNEDDLNDFIYARGYDFMIWEILILTALGVEPDGLIKECVEIFQEDEFKKAINIRSRYGIKLKEFSLEELRIKVERFVLNCVNIYNSIIQNYDENEIRPFHVCNLLFCKEFVEEIGTLSSIDVISNGCLLLKDNENLESRFLLNNFCKM